MTLNFLEIKTMNLGNYDAIVSPYAQQQGFGGFEQQGTLRDRFTSDDIAQEEEFDESAQENISSSSSSGGGGGGF